MEDVIRIGDVYLFKIGKLPDGLKETKTDVMYEGKTNSHRFKGGKIYFKKEGDYVFGYFQAKNTMLLHSPTEHGNHRIPDGAYRLEHPNEITHEGMRPMVD